MRRRPFLPLAFALAATLTLPLAARAQAPAPDGSMFRDPLAADRDEVATTAPGAVATVSLQLPLDSIRLPARYRISVVGRVRLYTPPEGRVDPPPRGTPALLPITFAVPREQEAGLLRIGDLSIEGADGRVYERPLRIDVSAVRNLTMEARARAATVRPGEPALIDVRVSNGGNATDTVAIRVDDGAYGGGGGLTWVVVPAKDTASTLVRVPTRRQFSGTAELIVRASGRGSAATASVPLRVSDEQQSVAPATLPARVFLGSSLYASGETTGAPEWAVSTGGMVAQRTHVQLDARQPRSGEVTPTAFTPYVLGPRLLLQVTRPDFYAQLGDVASYDEGFSGTFFSGRGTRVVGGRGEWDASAVVARPTRRGVADDTGDGLFARASVGHDLASGAAEFGVLHYDAGSAPNLERSFDLASARLGEFRFGDDRLSGEMAWLFSSDSAGGDFGGAAARLDYRREADDYGWNARLQRVPDVVTPGFVLQNVAEVGAWTRVTDGLRADGWTNVASAATPQLIGNSSRSTSVGLGTDWRGASFMLRANERRTDYDGAIADLSATERTASLGAAVRTGDFSFRGQAEFGYRDGSAGRAPIQALRAWGDWQTASTSVFLNAMYYRRWVGPEVVRLDLQGRRHLGATEIAAGIGGTLPDANGVSFWSQASHQLGFDATVVAGLEYLPWSVAETPWRFSLGVSQTVGLPAPYDGGAVRGIVFVDRDFDGERDAGEPVLRRVRVFSPSSTTETDRSGEFRLPLSGPAQVFLDPVSISEDMIAPAPVLARPGSTVHLAVTPAADLVVRVFADDDGDGEIGDLEAALGGAVIELFTEGEDAASRYGLSAEDGVARFTGLRPGDYRMRITPRGGPGMLRPAPRDVRLHLTPGHNDAAAPIAGEKRRIVFGEAKPAAVAPAPEPEPAATDAPTEEPTPTAESAPTAEPTPTAESAPTAEPVIPAAPAPVDVPDAVVPTLATAAFEASGIEILAFDVPAPEPPAVVVPVLPAEPLSDETRLTLERPIHFRFDSAVPLADELPLLRDKADALLDQPDVLLCLMGNTDRFGSNEYNLVLGRRRAVAVRDALVKEGVAAERLTVGSRGEENPISLGDWKEDHARNRRVDFEVVVGNDAAALVCER